jgi:hypothetical protein
MAQLTYFLLSRVLMARAQMLTEQVKTMAARIKQLETALASAENGPMALAALGDGQDSLQDCEPNVVEYEGELDRVSKFMGSLAITSEGKGHYYGATAGPEVRSLFPDRPSKLLMLCLQFLQHLMPEVCPRYLASLDAS